VRVERLVPGRRADPGLAGSVLARDIVVGRERWSKGRRLSADDLVSLAAPGAVDQPSVPVLVLEPGEIHEDDAALGLARLVAGPGLTLHGPVQSRVDLRAAAPGVLHIRIGDLELMNRIDPLEVFTAFDGTIVEAGELVASVKVAPHVVEDVLLDAAAVRTRDGARPIVWVAPFVARRVAVIVKESVRPAARERFEASVRAKVESLGSEIVALDYVADDPDHVRDALSRVARGPGKADVVLTAGGRSTDPDDPFFVALHELGGRVVRRGVPAHPGSMLWLGELGSSAVLGLPTCGAYSKATAADLVLPRLLTGERPSARLVAPLGHGGILTRDQRFRFPAYARELEAPEG
jgi:hypothetical protein